MGADWAFGRAHCVVAWSSQYSARMCYLNADLQSPQIVLSQQGSFMALMASLSHVAQRSFSGIEATSMEL